MNCYGFVKFLSASSNAPESSMVKPQSSTPQSQNENPPQPDDPVIKTTTPPTDGSNSGVDINIYADDGIVFTNIFGNHPYMRQDKQKSLGVQSHLKVIRRELLCELFAK